MKLGRNDQCWCKSGKKYKQCHMAFDEKIERFRLEGAIVPDHDLIKNKDQIAELRRVQRSTSLCWMRSEKRYVRA